MSGDLQGLERDARQLERLVAAQGHVGRVRTELEAGRREAVEILQQDALLLRHVDRSAGRFGQICHATEVVPVAVCDENRDATSGETDELVENPCGVGPWVDDDRLRRRVVGPDHVAIRPDRTELISVHCKAHEAFESNDGLSRALKIRAVQSWNLREIETPGGTRSPVVLRSDESARAVLIVLEPGQALGEHQMKERALVSVVDGSIRVESGG